MKVITNKAVIENKEFVLIEDTQNGKHFFGTIPYEEIDEHGSMKRTLNGFQMCIGDTIGDAIGTRSRAIKMAAWREAHPDATEIEIVMAAMNIN